MLAALAELRQIFAALASQARANYDFQFAMRAKLQQVVEAMEVRPAISFCRGCVIFDCIVGVL